MVVVNENITKDALRTFMRRVPSPVTVVTAATPDGERRGMTVGSFTSVSLEPILVSFNVGKDSLMNDVIANADSMVVHLLNEHQAAYSERFAAPDLGYEQQFADIPHRFHEDGTPILTETLGFMRCRKIASYDAGDHHLVVAEVLEIGHQSDGEPLLYYNTHYRAVGPIRDASTKS